MKMHSDYSYLEKALDTARMRMFFEKQLSARREISVPFDDIYIPRVFPRDENSFAIQYVIKVKSNRTGPPEQLILWGYLLGPGRELPAYATRAADDVILDHDLGLIVPIFPFDPALASLKKLCDRDATLKLLVGSGLAEQSVAWPTFDLDRQVMAYRPERRCVVRYNLPATKKANRCQQVVARAMRPKKLKRTLKSLSWLAASGFDSGLITIPKVLATNEANGLLFVEYVNGRTVHDLIGENDFLDSCRAASETLAKLHRLPAHEFSEYTGNDELDSLKGRLSQITQVFPDWSRKFEQSIKSLQLDWPRLSSVPEMVCIHRDFYDKQILWSPERTTLLDCDTLAAGDPALDHGNFLAHLVLRSLQVPHLASQIDRGRKIFERNIEKADAEFQHRVRWWQTASLIRLAALYSLRPRWHHLTGALLQKASHLNYQNKNTEFARD